MNRYALINSENIVDNIVLWDGVSEWTLPENMTCLNVEGIDCKIGWIYDGSTFTAPVVVEPTPAPAPTKEQLMAQLAALSTQIQALE